MAVAALVERVHRAAAEAEQALAEWGEQLASALFDEPTRRVLAGLVEGLRPGDSVQVTVVGDEAALGLPVELVRLPARPGGVVEASGD